MNPNLRNISILIVLFALALSGKAQSRDFSIVLDGTSYASPTTFVQESNVITVEFWAFREDWQTKVEEVLLSYHENGGWELKLSDGNIKLAIYLDGVERTISSPLISTTPGWHHIAFTFDGNYAKLYVDGYQQGYYFDFRSVIKAPLVNTWLSIGADATVNGVESKRFIGMIDEVRIWSKALVLNDLRDWMHRKITVDSKPSYINNLTVYYPFDSINVFKDRSVEYNLSLAYDLINMVSINDTLSSAPIQYFSEDYLNVRSLWSAFAQGTFSEPSGGLNLGIKNYDEYETDEADVFGHNGLTGVITEGTTNGVDLQASRVWFINKNHNEERPTLRFQLFDAGAGALYYDCIPFYNYKLMYKKTEADTFRIIDDCDNVEGNLIFFINIEVNSGFYTIARDNDVPTVTSAMQISNITSNSAEFGGVVGCDGGASVSAYGVCWNTSGSATIFDSLTVDGSGTGEFSSLLSNLEAGVVYYARTYATNSEGTAYGEEIAFETNKMYQSVTFPTISSKAYGTPDFDPGAFSSSGLPITYTSSKTSVAEIINGKIHINGIGSTTIWAYQAGNTNYSPSSYKKVTLVVEKAILTVKATNFNLSYGSELPELECTFDGFVYGENESSIDALPTMSTTATDSSSVGSYVITFSTGLDDKYNFILVEGTITISKIEPIISVCPTTTPIMLGEPLYNSELLGGEGCVNGEFLFADSTYVPSYNGEEVDVVFIPCDTVNFNSVAFKVAVMVDVVTKNHSSKNNNNISVYPNPCTSQITIKGIELNTPLILYTSSGRYVKTLINCNGVVNVSDLDPGVYLLRTKYNSILLRKH